MWASIPWLIKRFSIYKARHKDNTFCSFFIYNSCICSPSSFSFNFSHHVMSKLSSWVAFFRPLKFPFSGWIIGMQFSCLNLGEECWCIINLVYSFFFPGCWIATLQMWLQCMVVFVRSSHQFSFIYSFRKKTVFKVPTYFLMKITPCQLLFRK